MRSSGTFHSDAVVRKIGHIVSRDRSLRAFVVSRTPSGDTSVLFPGDGFHITGCRHDQEVPEIPEPAHSAHLGECKTFYRLVLIAVAAGIVPSGNSVRAYLYHAVRRSGTGESLPEPVIHPGVTDTCTRTDERVHIRCRRLKILPAIRAPGCGNKDGKRYHKIGEFHILCFSECKFTRKGGEKYGAPPVCLSDKSCR